MIVSLSLDDDDDSELYVFSGQDLLTAHYDQIDLDWHEVAERSIIDERRGLVITQVAILDDLIDEFILYLADPPDEEAYQREKLDTITLGPRIDLFEKRLRRAGLLTDGVSVLLADLRKIQARRNTLAHGTLSWQPIFPMPVLSDRDRPPTRLEWILFDRRRQTRERISMTQLRQDVYTAQGCFSALLNYAEVFVETAPQPTHFRGGSYLAAPTT